MQRMRSHSSFALALLLLAGCAGLRPLPPPAAACDAHGDLATLWRCVGVPDPDHRECSFTTTARVATGDMMRRLRDQSPAHACSNEPWSGFTSMNADVPNAAPLRAYAFAGDDARPVVFVLHGLFDSKADRYVRVAAEALARDGFGVVAPDLRFHGCLFQPSRLATLGIDEQRDLIAWADWLATQPHYQHRPFALLGFSLGALDAIQTAGSAEGARAFHGGAIAVSPGAPLERVQARIDGRPNPFRIGTDAVFVAYFRWFQRFRNHRLGLTLWSRTPFADYLEHTARKHEPPFASAAALIAAAQPADAMRRVVRPLLIITSHDDPIMTAASPKALQEAASGLANIHVIETRDGGHIGHLGRYAEWMAGAMRNFFANAAAVPSASAPR
jgi:predicted alpha/beta-fold hydrolase